MIRQMLNDPEMLRQMMNPAAMQQSMAMMQGMNGMGMPGADNTAQNPGQQADPFAAGGMPPFGMYGGMGGGFDPAMMAQMNNLNMGQPVVADTRPPREKYAT